MQKDFNKLLQDLKGINKVLLATYGQYGKSALIQSTNNATSNFSFMSTSDGETQNCLL